MPESHVVLSVRKATSSDLDRTFEWANDELTRANSFHRELIAVEAHRAWFIERVHNDDCHINMVEVNGEAVGIVRIEPQGAETTIGVTVAPRSRGRGLGRRMVQAALRRFLETNSGPVYAYINVENGRSIQMFGRAGFQFERMDSVNGIACKVLRVDRIEDLKS
jgi:UDP-2,4-diacetamido-2,4,6-trideoxy-beta-L-altropyranose hydrolase